MPREEKTSKQALPPQVVGRFKAIDATPELAEVAGKLILPAKRTTARTTALIAMWHSVERANRARDNVHDDLWVLGFLRDVNWAAEAPPYTKAPMRERRDKAKEIRRLASKLVRHLEVNGLDVHVVRQPKRFNATWLFFEEMSESNQRRCEADREPKLKVSGLVQAAAGRAATLLETEYYARRVGKQAKAVRFCRRLVELNEMAYQTPLYQVVATAANALFDVHYSEQDVMKLESR